MWILINKNEMVKFAHITDTKNSKAMTYRTEEKILCLEKCCLHVRALQEDNPEKG